MILNICYNDNCSQFPQEILTLCEAEFPEINVISFNENNFHEKKKAYKIKGSYSARMTPFVLITGDNKEYLKAFYSEDKGCTIDNIKKFLNVFK